MSSGPQTVSPVFPTPALWALRVLAWIAFGISAYLAWNAINQTPVAGCGVGSETGCDKVLGSAWSKWLGMPVAVAGLACYATLAALSVLLSVRNPRFASWINTTFLLLASVAAIASGWFLAIQIFAIGHFCPYCVVADLCGIAIGALAIGFTLRWLHATRLQRSASSPASGLIALRAATGAHKAAPGATWQLQAPSLTFAIGGALAMAAILIGGQLLFPEKSYELQQVALTESIDMDGSREDAQAEPLSTEPNEFLPDDHVAMRIPSEPIEGANEDLSGSKGDSAVVAAQYEETEEAVELVEESPLSENEQPSSESPSEAGDDQSEQDLDAPVAADAEPKRERFVTFLDGKLTIDIYKHPHIGSPEAPHVLVELVSYDCSHCRETHRLLKRALRRYGDQVAVVVMIVPLEQKCNKLVTNARASHPGACATARMALGVAALKPESFAKFHDWLMADEEKPPAVDRTVARAYGLVNSDRLRELSDGDTLEKQIEQYVNLYAALSKQNAGNKDFGLPVQILGDHVLSGSVDNPADLYDAWEKHLGVQP